MRLLLCILLFIAGCSLPQASYLNSGKIGHGYAKSLSMAPTIMVGDEVIYGYYWDTLTVGNIAIRANEYWDTESTERLIPHRIVGEIASGVYRTRGDNNDTIDPVPLTEYNYRGTVLSIRRNNQIVYSKGK